METQYTINKHISVSFLILLNNFSTISPPLFVENDSDWCKGSTARFLLVCPFYFYTGWENSRRGGRAWEGGPEGRVAPRLSIRPSIRPFFPFTPFPFFYLPLFFPVFSLPLQLSQQPPLCPSPPEEYFYQRICKYWFRFLAQKTKLTKQVLCSAAAVSGVYNTRGVKKGGVFLWFCWFFWF